MTFVSVSQCHATYYGVNADLAYSVFINSVLNVKALVGAFNQEKALVGAFSMIVKTYCETDGSSAALVPRVLPALVTGAGPGRDNVYCSVHVHCFHSWSWLLLVISRYFPSAI